MNERSSSRRHRRAGDAASFAVALLGPVGDPLPVRTRARVPSAEPRRGDAPAANLAAERERALREAMGDAASFDATDAA